MAKISCNFGENYGEITPEETLVVYQALIGFLTTHPEITSHIEEIKVRAVNGQISERLFSMEIDMSTRYPSCGRHLLQTTIGSNTSFDPNTADLADLITKRLISLLKSAVSYWQEESRNQLAAVNQVAEFVEKI